MTYCSNCDAAVDETARTCPECGASFQAPDSGRDATPRVDLEFVVRIATVVAAMSFLGSLMLLGTRGELTGASLGGWILPFDMLWMRGTTEFVLVFAVLWGVAATGLWYRTTSGLLAGAAVYGLTVVVGVLILLHMHILRDESLLLSVVFVDPFGIVLALLPRLLEYDAMFNQWAGVFRNIRFLAIPGLFASALVAWALWRASRERSQ